MLDHPIILIIVVALALIRWLFQKAKAEKENADRPEAPSEPIPRSSETQTEEERIRRFLEALGQPPGSAPPKVAPRRQMPPRVFPTLPPLTTAPPPLPPPMPVSPVQTSAPVAMPKRVFTPAIVQEAGFEVQDIDQRKSGTQRFDEWPPAADQRSLIAQLSSPRGLRSAIVLREIFGPPRSLQPLDLSNL
jgi:hypothetical protein